MGTVILTRAARRLAKILHTLGAIGFMGGMAALLALAVLAPVGHGGAVHGAPLGDMATVAAWLVAPGMILTVVSGLLAMAANPAFYDLGWVWAKAATGILVLEGGLHLLGPLQEEAKRGAGALASAAEPSSVAPMLAAEANTLWVLLGVSAANVVLGVWRPRFSLSKD